MKYCIFCVFFLSMAPGTRAGEIVRRQILTHSGVERSYDLYVPSSYEPGRELPLWFHLHGLGGNGTETMSASRVNEIAELEGIIAAYPSAINGDWLESPDHNLGFMHALIEKISDDYDVDAGRIYSSGYSQGGIASYIFGAASPNTFAAIAVGSGTRYSHIDNIRDDVRQFMAETPTAPSRPVPLLAIHGTRDTVVPYNGGDKQVGAYGTVSYPPVEDLVNAWSSANRCDETPTTSTIPAGPDSIASTAVLSFENCESYTSVTGIERSADVKLYQVDKGRHRWHIDANFDTNEAVWAFFSQHERRATPLKGDFNSDGHLNATDINQLALALRDRSASSTFDLNSDDLVNFDDHGFWVTETYSTYFGDANLDGVFDSGDLIQVFQRNEYEDGIAGNSGWEDGDWNGDLEFDSRDFVAAFRSEGYEVGPRPSLNSVPEPSSLPLVLMGVLGQTCRRRLFGVTRGLSNQNQATG